MLMAFKRDHIHIWLGESGGFDLSRKCLISPKSILEPPESEEANGRKTSQRVWKNVQSPNENETYYLGLRSYQTSLGKLPQRIREAQMKTWLYNGLHIRKPELKPESATYLPWDFWQAPHLFGTSTSSSTRLVSRVNRINKVCVKTLQTIKCYTYEWWCEKKKSTKTFKEQSLC